MNDFPTVYNKNRLAVIISPGYGSELNWPMCLRCDPILLNELAHLRLLTIELIMERISALKQGHLIKKSSFKNYENDYCILRNIDKEDFKVEFVPKDITFRISEYDGSEHIEYYNEAQWYTA